MNIIYPKNLSFECSKCGLCCGDTQVKKRNILLLESDVKRISLFTKSQINAFAKKTRNQSPYIYKMHKIPKEGKCIFLKNNRCTIYDYRPLICRFYPFELTEDEGNYRFEATKECPSISSEENLEIGKKLNRSYFLKLLKMASMEIR